ncbi:MAG TPA: DEAD/DEAH box helicase, partial [Acidimicrobiaceae bacterium]|nr:DEAD/DEAH box helicase [Acidimicrobiaceae bacterium]
MQRQPQQGLRRIAEPAELTTQHRAAAAPPGGRRSHPDLAAFSAPVADWFAGTFAEPTPAQSRGWRAIAGGDHTLVAAPTGSGKTLAAFLWGIDRVIVEPVPEIQARTRVLYLSPLRALATDIDKNLRAPLRGIELAAERLGIAAHSPTVGVRTGDTPAAERRRLVTRPPDILITTPESLYLMLTSRARETLSGVRWVIVDEIHSVAGGKRGTHLAVSLERLCLRTAVEPQRIGLSATQRPLSEVAEFLGGWSDGDAGTRRRVEIVDVGNTKQLDVEVIVPVDDMGDLSGVESDSAVRVNSIWPAVHPRVLELILEHRSTIVFVNARRLAERLASRLNELHATGVNRAAEADGVALSPEPPDPDDDDCDLGDYDLDDDPPAPPVPDLVRAHHGSISREQRLTIEDDLKSGRLRAIVATSSLELGIDMGAVDLVIQVGSPGSVASGMQRIGRAGHQVGAPSVGKLFPRHRGDLVEAAVVVQRMQAGLIEQTHYPRQPLDVLAQHIVAMAAVDDWSVADLLAVVRRSAPYHRLSESVFESVLDLLAGRYPSQEFAELRPRIVWDRLAGTIRPRQGAARLAVTNGGTIADRGLYAVFTLDGSRVGELDEEMVYEARAGETFLLGASSWRIEEITHDRVLVSPAPGVPAKMPFWHGDGPGRPLELGRAVGAFVRETVDALPAGALSAGPSASTGPLADRLVAEHGLDRSAAANVLLYLDAQRQATGVVPDDRTVVVERFRDEIGDWRICVMTPFGAQVHAPWAIAVASQHQASTGVTPDVLWSDDGIVLRLPDTELPDAGLDGADPRAAGPNGIGPGDADPVDPVSLISLDPDTVNDTIVAHLPGTALFASRFREVAGRALLLPRRRPGERTPLWQQRRRAASLLEVAAKYPSFPMLLETTRECLQDVFDVPALTEVLRDIAGRRIRVVAVDTDGASPMAQNLVFDWIAVHMYGGDAPLAERRAAALSLNRELLADLLGPEELRELLDPEVLADLEIELARIRARDVDQMHDELRRLGDLSDADIAARTDATPHTPADAASPHPTAADSPVAWVAQLLTERRACRVRVAEEERVIATEDAALYRDALGCALPQGLPAALVTPATPTGAGATAAAPFDELVARFAAGHGPFTADAPAARFGVVPARVDDALVRLAEAGRVVGGAFRPDGVGREWCDTEVLRTLRRRSLARLRREVEPVTPDAYARFLPAWHGIDRPRRGVDALADAVTLLAGAPIVASTLDDDVLPARVRDYRPADLDALLAGGEVVWMGAGAVGPRDGRIRLFWRADAPALAPDVAGLGDDGAAGPVHQALRAALAEQGSLFWPDLLAAVAAAGTNATAPVLAALWDLVWAGEVTNDTMAPLRAVLAGAAGGRAAGRGTRRTGRHRRRPGRDISALSRSGPPSAGGRWSSTAALLRNRPDPAERAHRSALNLLERHGVLTRSGALGEQQPGGFAGVYGLLRALEERGSVRRGYFIEGLGGAQFAMPAALESLRAHRSDAAGNTAASTPGDDDPDGRAVLVLAATDPAQPYGAALAWPKTDGRPTRSAGAQVVLADGVPLVVLDRGGRGLHTFEGCRDVRWIEALRRRVAEGRIRAIELARIDGAPAATHP